MIFFFYQIKDKNVYASPAHSENACMHVYVKLLKKTETTRSITERWGLNQRLKGLLTHWKSRVSKGKNKILLRVDFSTV